MTRLEAAEARYQEAVGRCSKYKISVGRTEEIAAGEREPPSLSESRGLANIVLMCKAYSELVLEQEKNKLEQSMNYFKKAH